MSNDVRIYSTRSTRYTQKGGKTISKNLASRIEASNEKCLNEALSIVHTAAVENAWKIRDTGLLANSIYYTTDNGKTLHGLNTKETIHTIKEDAYRAEIAKSPIRESERKFVATGYIGTSVARMYDEHPLRDTKVVEKTSKTYQKDKAEYPVRDRYDPNKGGALQYAPLVEYGTRTSVPKPFLKAAFETARKEMEHVIVQETTFMVKHVMDAVFLGGAE